MSEVNRYCRDHQQLLTTWKLRKNVDKDIQKFGMQSGNNEHNCDKKTYIDETVLGEDVAKSFTIGE